MFMDRFNYRAWVEPFTEMERRNNKEIFMIKKMNHAGIMPNYECTAACRHCLYACSPERAGGYMSEQVMHEVCGILNDCGCRSVHIGGGEPFLNFDGLLKLLRIANQYGIRIDYIETNASWVGDEALVKRRLKELRAAGADTFCISVDPYHVEYVPLSKPLRLAKICAEYDFNYFLWQERFLSVMQNLDREIPFSRAALEKIIGKNYVYDIARAYGLHMGGRAINIEHEYILPKQIVLTKTPCSGLLSGNHFHVDMYNRFIPPGCTGIAIELKDAAYGLPPGKYPVFEALLNRGISGLYEYAIAKNYIPDENGYTSACAMCFHIRKWLSELGSCPELCKEHYTQSLRFYEEGSYDCN